MSKTEVSPDAEAIARKIVDMVLYRHDRQADEGIRRHWAAKGALLITAATMREREAIEQLIEEAIQSVTSPTATAARTMARTILSTVRARSTNKGA